MILEVYGQFVTDVATGRKMKPRAGASPGGRACLHRLAGQARRPRGRAGQLPRRAGARREEAAASRASRTSSAMGRPSGLLRAPQREARLRKDMAQLDRLVNQQHPPRPRSVDAHAVDHHDHGELASSRSPTAPYLASGTPGRDRSSRQRAEPSQPAAGLASPCDVLAHRSSASLPPGRHHRAGRQSTHRHPAGCVGRP